MHHIKHKLQNNRGASMLLALMYLLLCITIGTVVITAASTSVKYEIDSWQAEQRYQAVASAAKLLTADLEQAVYTGSYQKIETSVYTPAAIDVNGKVTSKKQTEKQEPAHTLMIPESSITGSKLLITLEKTSADNDFDRLYRSALPTNAQPAYQALTSDEAFMQYPLFFEAVDDLPAVTGKLTVQSKPGTVTPLYTITAVLWVEADNKKHNATTLVFKPIIMEQIPLVNVASESDDTSTTTTTTFTYTTQVRWNAPIVTKGGVAE